MSPSAIKQLKELRLMIATLHRASVLLDKTNVYDKVHDYIGDAISECETAIGEVLSDEIDSRWTFNAETRVVTSRNGKIILSVLPCKRSNMSAFYLEGCKSFRVWELDEWYELIENYERTHRHGHRH